MNSEDKSLNIYRKEQQIHGCKVMLQQSNQILNVHKVDPKATGSGQFLKAAVCCVSRP